MSTVSTQETRNIIEKMSILEKRIDEIYSMVQEMRVHQDMHSNYSVYTRPDQNSTLLDVYERDPNPWAIQTSAALDTAVNILSDQVKQRVTKASLDTYKPTIKVLHDNAKGLSAEEVSHKTGRKRNTESAYLWRLYLAGIVGREKQHNKIIYKLKDRDRLRQTIRTAKKKS